MRSAFSTDSIIFFFDNNYISIDDEDIKSQPYDVRMPFPDFRYLIYGPELRISLYRISELMQNGGGFRSNSRYRDALPEDAPYFNLATLEYRVTKNSVPESNWKPVLNAASYFDTSSYIDTFNVQVNKKEMEGKIFYRKGNLLYHNTNISNGDSLLISFRKGKNSPFLHLGFVKKDPLLSPPCYMGSFHNQDEEFPVEKFIQEAYKHYLTRDQSFYRYWPGSSVRQNDKVFEDSKLALFFRPRTDIANDTAFEYRLLTNGKASQWKKSDNIIYAYDLKAGNQYRLEVRYTDKPQYVYPYQFYVPANWYQSAWLKTAIIFVLLLIALLLYFFFKNIRRKRLQAEQINKMKALSAQLNPHFVFNALGSIQGLLNNGQIENANHYLSGFGKLLRNTLISTEKNTITLQEEMNDIENYIKLEQLRKDFNYIVQVQDNINLSGIEILPLLFQPIIENAIKHGPMGNEIFEMKLKINKENDNMNISIEDNGKGFNVHSPKTGQGLKLTKARIDLFNLMTKNKKIIQKISSNENGTIFYLTFINWLRND
ncbi:MAG TPA: histidine kinase [Niabella sp.]|nr:histidine kinase [Niabella sp.]